MSKPIKETPILKGKDAELFLAAIQNPEKISERVKQRMRGNFEKLDNIAKFFM